MMAKRRDRSAEALARIAPRVVTPPRSVVYRAPEVIDHPANHRIRRIRERLANWGSWCRGIGAVVPDGYGAGLADYDSSDPMVRDEGWGNPAPPAELSLPFDPADAREIEEAVSELGKAKPGHVWTLTQCYVRERHVDAESRLRAEASLLDVLDKP